MSGITAKNPASEYGYSPPPAAALSAGGTQQSSSTTRVFLDAHLQDVVTTSLSAMMQRWAATSSSTCTQDASRNAYPLVEELSLALRKSVSRTQEETFSLILDEDVFNARKRDSLDSLSNALEADVFGGSEDITSPVYPVPDFQSDAVKKQPIQLGVYPASHTLAHTLAHAAPRVPGLPLISLTCPSAYDIEAAIRRVETNYGHTEIVLIVEPPPVQPVESATSVAANSPSGAVFSTELLFNNGVPYFVDVTEGGVKYLQEAARVVDLRNLQAEVENKKTARNVTYSREPALFEVPSFFLPLLHYFRKSFGDGARTLESTVADLVHEKPLRVAYLPRLQRDYVEEFVVLDTVIGVHNNDVMPTTTTTAAKDTHGSDTRPVILVSYNAQRVPQTLSRIVAAMLPREERRRASAAAAVRAEQWKLIRSCSLHANEQYWQQIQQQRDESDKRRRRTNEPLKETIAQTQPAAAAASETEGAAARLAFTADTLPSHRSVSSDASARSTTTSPGSKQGSKQTSSKASPKQRGAPGQNSPAASDSAKAHFSSPLSASAAANLRSVRRQNEDVAYVEMVRHVQALAATTISVWYRKLRLKRTLGTFTAVSDTVSGGSIGSWSSSLARTVQNQLRVAHRGLFTDREVHHEPQLGTNVTQESSKPFTVWKPTRRLPINSLDDSVDGFNAANGEHGWEQLTVWMPPETLVCCPLQFNPTERINVCNLLSGNTTWARAVELRQSFTGASALQRRVYNTSKSRTLEILHAAYLELRYRGRLPSTISDFRSYIVHYHRHLCDWFAVPHLASAVLHDFAHSTGVATPSGGNSTIAGRIVIPTSYCSGKQELGEPVESAAASLGNGTYLVPCPENVKEWSDQLKDLCTQAPSVAWLHVSANPTVFIHGISFCAVPIADAMAPERLDYESHVGFETVASATGQAKRIPSAAKLRRRKSIEPYALAASSPHTEQEESSRKAVFGSRVIFPLSEHCNLFHLGMGQVEQALCVQVRGVLCSGREVFCYTPSMRSGTNESGPTHSRITYYQRHAIFSRIPLGHRFSFVRDNRTRFALSSTGVASHEAAPTKPGVGHEEDQQQQQRNASSRPSSGTVRSGLRLSVSYSLYEKERRRSSDRRSSERRSRTQSLVGLGSGESTPVESMKRSTSAKRASIDRDRANLQEWRNIVERIQHMPRLRSGSSTHTSAPPSPMAQRNGSQHSTENGMSDGVEAAGTDKRGQLADTKLSKLFSAARPPPIGVGVDSISTNTPMELAKQIVVEALEHAIEPDAVAVQTPFVVVDKLAEALPPHVQVAYERVWPIRSGGALWKEDLSNFLSLVVRYRVANASVVIAADSDESEFYGYVASVASAYVARLVREKANREKKGTPRSGSPNKNKNRTIPDEKQRNDSSSLNRQVSFHISNPLSFLREFYDRVNSCEDACDSNGKESSGSAPKSSKYAVCAPVKELLGISIAWLNNTRAYLSQIEHAVADITATHNRSPMEEDVQRDPHAVTASSPANVSRRTKIVALTRLIERHCYLVLLCMFFRSAAVQRWVSSTASPLPSFSEYVDRLHGVTAWMDTVDPWAHQPQNSPDPYHTRYSNVQRRWDDESTVIHQAL